MEWPQADPTSPYFLRGPTLISFSGGRTSAYMLFMILCAHGGQLPPDCYVVFANTGREMPETLRFVHECEARWGVKIWWVEWRPAKRRAASARIVCTHQRRGRCVDCARDELIDAASGRFEIVGFNSADRDGVWFAELIRRKMYLPNQDMRYCTTTLKIETMKWFMVSRGLATWNNVVGLRADEMHRVMKQVLRNASGKERWYSYCPLALAGVIERIVWRFWLGDNQDPRRLTSPLPQGFDLGLRRYEGNCDLCFLKGRGKKAAVIREHPACATWWIWQEELTTVRTGVTTAYAKRFHKGESMRQLVDAVEASPTMIGFDDGDNVERDAECGVSCLGDDSTEPLDDSAIDWIMEQLKRIRDNPVDMPAARAAVAPALGDLFAEMEIEDA